jgi:hypothetical protein
MNYVKSTFIAVIFALTSSAAWGQADPQISIVVEATPEQVTLSRLSLDTFAAFKVTFKNGASSALRRVFLNGTATNFGATDPVVVYDSFIAITTPTDTCEGGSAPNTNTVSCILTDLGPGASTAFIVVFKAPTNGARIDFNWTAGGSEGRGGGKGCCSQSSLAPVQTTLVDPSTNPSFNAEAKTFVKPTGGTVFTGSEGITTEGDGWSTTVVIPSFTSQAFAVALIKEVSSADPTPPSPQLACPPWSTFSTCFATTLLIPGTFDDPLDVKIRLDKSFFNLGRMDPATVPLHYKGDPLNVPDYVTYPHRLLLCSVDEKNLGHRGPIPLKGRPCLSKPPMVYPNGYKIKELRGDLEFNVRARDNGVYEQ